MLPDKVREGFHKVPPKKNPANRQAFQKDFGSSRRTGLQPKSHESPLDLGARPYVWIFRSTMELL
jgi:hypothetical protein